MPHVQTLCDVATAAALLAVSPKTIRRQVASGALPAIRIGKCIRIRLADIDALLHPKN